VAKTLTPIGHFNAYQRVTSPKRYKIGLLSVYCWLLQVPLFVVCLPVCLSVCLVSICKHDFCKKSLSNFNITWGVSCYYGVVVRNVKFSPNRLVYILKPLGWNSSAVFCWFFDIISIIYANIQNPLCNFVAHPYIIHTQVSSKSDVTWQFKYKSS